MSSSPLKHWTTWPWMLIVGSMQVYILYSSIRRYINLKHEVLNGFLLSYKDFEWIFALLNYQLLAIILGLGILPLWLYSTIFSSSSLSCRNNSFIGKKGFYQFVWDEAVSILFRHGHMDVVNGDHFKCCKNIKMAVFIPVSNLLHVLMAYILIVPLPFMEAWLIHTNDDRKETVWTNDLEFLGSNSYIVKIKCSIEYFNFFFSLLNLSFQFPKLLWSSNKLFSVFLNSIQILVCIHILISFSLFSIFIKFYYKYLLINHILITPCMILIITSLSDALLLFTSFPYFQFGFEKCVQCLLRSPWFNNINKLETIPLANNYEQSNCQSTTTSSAYYMSKNILNINTGMCSTLSAAALFLIGMILRVVGSYEYWYYLRSSSYFMIYFANTLLLVMAYFIMWIGMCLKPNWIFTLTETQLTQYSIITYPEKVESNDYKSLRSQQGNSQISLSVVSNANNSTQSKKREFITKLDLTNNNQYLSQCTSLTLPSCKSQNGSNEYLKLNNHGIQSNIYRSIYGSNTLSGNMSPSNAIYVSKDLKRTLSPTYKCSTPPSYSILRSNESARSDESSEFIKKLNAGFAIEEEINNETDFSSSEEVLLEDQMKNNSQFKFVTFQLDANAKISTDLYSSTENMTIGSLETSENFIKELENGTDMNVGYTSFIENKKFDKTYNSLYVLESPSNIGKLKM